MKVNWKDENLIKTTVQRSYCYRDVLRNLGLKSKGGNNRTLKKWIEKYKIDISHFDPYHNIIEDLRNTNTISLDEILEGKHPEYNRHRLKLRLLSAGIKTNNCEECGQSGTWNDKELNMQLDHINGINDDNRLKNLRMLCPNCHTQTENFAGKSNKINNGSDG